MLVKYLHERKEVNCSEIESNKQRKLTLEYYVLREDSDTKATTIGAGIGDRYGVMVVMDNSVASRESRVLHDVTPYETEARKYAQILAEHCVTPCVMLDVMEDLVAGAASL